MTDNNKHVSLIWQGINFSSKKRFYCSIALSLELISTLTCTMCSKCLLICNSLGFYYNCILRWAIQCRPNIGKFIFVLLKRLINVIEAPPPPKKKVYCIGSLDGDLFLVEMSSLLKFCQLELWGSCYRLRKT
jgi:hypothetical protein